MLSISYTLSHGGPTGYWHCRVVWSEDVSNSMVVRVIILSARMVVWVGLNLSIGIRGTGKSRLG